MGGLDWLRAWVFSLIFLGWTLCETRKATKAEYQPYIVSLHDQFDVYHYIPDNSNTVINFVGDFDIKNVGRTPASNIQVTATIKYKARNYGERKDFHEKGVIDSFMKRCVLAIFALNLLCAPISYAQDNPAPSQKTTKSSPAQNSKTPAPAVKTEPQNNESKKDLKPIIPADNPSIDERMAKIAQEANDFSEIQTYINGVGLFLLFLTTLYARGAWQAGNRAVRVGKIDAMGNLIVKDIRHSALIFNEDDKMSAHKLREGLVLSVEFMVSNHGRSIAKNASLEMRAALIANNPDKNYRQLSRTIGLNVSERKVENPIPSEPILRNLDDIPASESVPVRQGFVVPHGDAVGFNEKEVLRFTIQYIEMRIVLKYETAFGDKTVVKQTFGIRTLEKDGLVERIAHNQNNK